MPPLISQVTLYRHVSPDSCREDLRVLRVILRVLSVSLGKMFTAILTFMILVNSFQLEISCLCLKTVFTEKQRELIKSSVTLYYDNHLELVVD